MLTFALLNTRTILMRVGKDQYGSAWRSLVGLMAFFCIGYVGAAYLIWADIDSWLLLLVGIVFLLGALFVWMVVRIGLLTIQDLYETRYSRNALEEEVQRRTAELQAKNTVLLKSQQELARSRDEALQAYQARSAFLRNMSHELRTPLNAILGYSEILLEELENEDDSAALRTDLQKIRTAGKNLLSMIGNILDLSKMETGETKPSYSQFDIATKLHQVIYEVASLSVKNNNDLVIEIDPNLSIIECDEEKLERILFNLLTNAYKFTKDGTVTVTAVQEELSGDPWLNIKITDTGIGITSDYLERLFEPFGQADSSMTRRYGGVGLGLVITQQFCRLLKGDLKVDSVYGIGSTFTVRLPIRPLQTDEYEAGDEEPLPVGRPTALVVDDDPAVRDLLSRWLTREGFHIRTAANGSEGIRLARKLHPQVITLDVMMPDVDGWHVLSTLKTDPTTADIPIVMMTIVEDRQHGYALGAADYLTKPINREQLLQVLYRYAMPLKSNTILVVEDDDATREIMERTLSRQGWLVETAKNGRVALDKIAQQIPTLIILDLMMPETDGFEFIDEFSKEYHGHSIPIIVLTAKDLTPSERNYLRNSVKVVMQKGVYRHDDLLAEIRRLLAVTHA